MKPSLMDFLNKRDKFVYMKLIIGILKVNAGINNFYFDKIVSIGSN